MREQLIFEAEPFEFDSEFDEYEEEQADSYAEFDSEEEFDTERADEEWQEEVNRHSQDYLRWVQSALNKVMGLRLTVDGLMGIQTRSAIRSFQQRQGLTADGILGPQTEAALIAAGGGSPPGSGSAPSASAACPPRPTFVDCPPPGTPFEVLDNFAFDGFQLNRPLHTPRIIKIAQQIIASQKSAQPIRSLLIAGHTDPVGNDDYNFRLSRQRAETAMRELCTTLERMSPGLAGRIRFQVTSCGERQPKTKPELSRRVEVFLPKQVTPPPPRKPTTQDIKIVVKSFISPIGARIGSPTCSLLVPLPPPAPPIPTPATARLAVLARATDVAFSENPRTDVKDKAYRLFSARTFRITCQNGKISSVVPSGLDIDAGEECLPGRAFCLQPPALITSGISSRLSGPSTFSFSWTAKGKPHPTAEPTFQVVCPRTSVFIWHTVVGQIDCSGPTIKVTAKVVGSQFPSHRVFVNGGIRSTVPQGVFSNLWVADLSDRTLVR
jgi:outer membrane protein OmpA-like peptidoglycan-associated protein